VYFASADGLRALWQFVGYYGQIDHATTRCSTPFWNRRTGCRSPWGSTGGHLRCNGPRASRCEGGAWPLFQSGNSILFVALLAAFWRAWLSGQRARRWQTLSALMLTTWPL